MSVQITKSRFQNTRDSSGRRLFTIPKGSVFYHGTRGTYDIATDSVTFPWVDDLASGEPHALNKSLYLAEKDVADKYGAKHPWAQKNKVLLAHVRIVNFLAASKNEEFEYKLPLAIYKTSGSGKTLAFRFTRDTILTDVGDLATLRAMAADNYKNMLSTFAEGDQDDQRTIPTSVERKSSVYTDAAVAKELCSKEKSDGWVYVKGSSQTRTISPDSDRTLPNPFRFHSEIMLCKPGSCVEFMGVVEEARPIEDDGGLGLPFVSRLFQQSDVTTYDRTTIYIMRQDLLEFPNMFGAPVAILRRLFQSPKTSSTTLKSGDLLYQFMSSDIRKLESVFLDKDTLDVLAGTKSAPTTAHTFTFRARAEHWAMVNEWGHNKLMCLSSMAGRTIPLFHLPGKGCKILEYQVTEDITFGVVDKDAGPVEPEHYQPDGRLWLDSNGKEMPYYSDRVATMKKYEARGFKGAYINEGDFVLFNPSELLRFTRVLQDNKPPKLAVPTLKQLLRQTKPILKTIQQDKILSHHVNLDAFILHRE